MSKQIVWDLDGLGDSLANCYGSAFNSSQVMQLRGGALLNDWQ